MKTMGFSFLQTQKHYVLLFCFLSLPKTKQKTTKRISLLFGLPNQNKTGLERADENDGLGFLFLFVLFLYCYFSLIRGGWWLFGRFLMTKRSPQESEKRSPQRRPLLNEILGYRPFKPNTCSNRKQGSVRQTLELQLPTHFLSGLVGISGPSFR